MKNKKMLEIDKMITLSTALITEHTAIWLDNSEDIICYKKGDHGWFIYVMAYEGLPSELRALLQVAIENNCTWLCLDRDADIIKELPTYNW